MLFDLLWSGGWDSTYRLLYLLIVRRDRVRPHYIVDENRRSVPYELRAMRDIKRAMVERFPYTRELIEPTIIRLRTDIEPDREIAGKYQKLLEIRRIGHQNEWMAAYAEGAGLTALEIGTNRADSSRVLKIECSQWDEETERYVLRERLPDPNMEFFRRFSMPLLDMTKLDMLESARRHGFDAMMYQSWFCHRPTRRGKPCGGLCGPCQDAIAGGLGHRIGLPNRVMHGYRRLYKRRLRTLLNERILPALGRR
jgi:7-cyano-7-deazaguanine synthase in queuosine biosynthesis